ncbi:MAG TPA: ATP-binding protein, partial [Actinomycetota bacterium]|nr:ATP-binding protein [Actinomycetota bacterium]
VAGAGPPVPFRSIARDGLRSGYGSGDDRVETLYAPLTVSGRALGVLGLGISRSAAVPGGSTRALALGVLVAAAVLLALAIGWRASRAISVPVGDLVAATKALEQGELATRAESDSRDEIGRLAESFNVMAAELQASHEELERKVAERTAELERVNAELARVSEAKSQFLATMSHELRTPLNAVIGFADFLSDPAFGPPSPKDVRKIAQDIHASGTHLLTLINDLLDLAKIEAGRVEFDLRPVRLRDVARDVEAVCRPLAAAKDIRLVVKVPARLPDVTADPGRVRQVLLNLIGNAIKFTPAGGTVTVTAAEEASLVAVSVTDTGPGMTGEEAATIFEPFERTSKARGIEGAGLGLALARRFVEIQGGTIDVRTAPGKGATFRFTLPRTRAAAARASRRPRRTTDERAFA